MTPLGLPLGWPQAHSPGIETCPLPLESRDGAGTENWPERVNILLRIWFTIIKDPHLAMFKVIWKRAPFRVWPHPHREGRDRLHMPMRSRWFHPWCIHGLAHSSRLKKMGCGTEPKASFSSSETMERFQLECHASVMADWRRKVCLT